MCRRIDCPHSAERIGPCACESSWTGCHGRTGTQKREQSGCDNNSKRWLQFHGWHPAAPGAEGLKLGSQVTEGFLVSGNTNVNGASEEANLSVPLSGVKGKGTIYVAATKSLGRWNYSGLVLEIERTHQRIDFLQRPAPASSP